LTPATPGHILQELLDEPAYLRGLHAQAQFLRLRRFIRDGLHGADAASLGSPAVRFVRNFEGMLVVWQDGTVSG